MSWTPRPFKKIDGLEMANRGPEAPNCPTTEHIGGR